jgi:hypothetical protein
MPSFVIQDELHAEVHGDFGTLDEALAELRRRAAIAWDAEPNLAPCTNWATCGRHYEILEYPDAGSMTPVRIPVVRLDATGVRWKAPFVDGFVVDE